ncbi:MAG: hypothetical protein ACOC0D_09375 [Spirochaeta sp.]
MIHHKNISEQEIRQTIEAGEFPAHILNSSRNVAVIATQDWCPEWRNMQRWVKSEQEDPEPNSPDVDIYLIIYNNTDFQQEFMQLKENTWENGFIPYVRYYRNGEFQGDSNGVTSRKFYQRFLH